MQTLLPYPDFARSAGVLDIPRRGASYQRQRAVAEATDGDLVAVVDSVVRELRTSLGDAS